MSFWTALRSCNDRTNFGINFLSAFANEVSGGGGQIAGMDIHTYRTSPFLFTHAGRIGYFPTMYYLSDLRFLGDAPIETARVFVLGWRVDGISSVTFTTLQGYDYFLTSEFSGCRFVVTNEGVSHIAWSAGGQRSSGNASQAQRDQAEAGSSATVPTFRRRLSISASAGGLDASRAGLSADNPGFSYDVATQRVMVFGFKEHGIWHFKMLTYPQGSSQVGRWTNFISVRIGA